MWIVFYNVFDCNDDAPEGETEGEEFYKLPLNSKLLFALCFYAYCKRCICFSIMYFYSCLLQHSRRELTLNNIYNYCLL